MCELGSFEKQNLQGENCHPLIRDKQLGVQPYSIGKAKKIAPQIESGAFNFLPRYVFDVVIIAHSWASIVTVPDLHFRPWSCELDLHWDYEHLTPSGSGIMAG